MVLVLQIEAMRSEMRLKDRQLESLRQQLREEVSKLHRALQSPMVQHAVNMAAPAIVEQQRQESQMQEDDFAEAMQEELTSLKKSYERQLFDLRNELSELKRRQNCAAAATTASSLFFRL
jgi:hypothetical protein